MRSLLDDGPWDSYDLGSLLPLKEVIRETSKFGFLIRHYWIPATILMFRHSTRTTFRDGRQEATELEIVRKMARCRSSKCLWRETVRPAMRADTDGQYPVLSEMLCSYDCYRQTYWSDRPTLFAELSSEQESEARRLALYRLPMLCPPGPIPLGSEWHAKVGDDYMNYHLEAEKQVGETSVLVIRREGRYTTWLSSEAIDPGGRQDRMPVAIERKGITLFAWNRAAILEDRFEDRVIPAERCSASAEVTSHAVTRLVRSCPDKLANSVREETNNQEIANHGSCKCPTIGS